jgi:hypothetical protein
MIIENLPRKGMLANAGGLGLGMAKGRVVAEADLARQKENRRSLASLGMTKRRGFCRERAVAG